MNNETLKNELLIVIELISSVSEISGNDVVRKFWQQNLQMIPSISMISFCKHLLNSDKVSLKFSMKIAILLKNVCLSMIL